VPALWLENALIVSMMAVAVVFFEAIWNADFFARLLFLLSPFSSFHRCNGD
jgi:hypothetical protein